MPKALEKKLKATARKRGYSEERSDAFVYGSMRKTGWVPSTQKGSKPKPKTRKTSR